MELKDVIFTDSFPSLDLHGFDRESARVAINDFIEDNFKMGNEIVVVVHGIGTGIIRNTTFETLKKNKLVIDFKSDNFNRGCTIIKLLNNKN